MDSAVNLMTFLRAYRLAALPLLLAAVLVGPPAAWAQTPAQPADATAPLPPPGDPQALGDESAIHSSAASFAVTKLKDTPAVVSVITADEIRSMGARDLVDILMMVPGIFFGIDNQNVLGTSFRGLWGYEGKMLLLIDGKEMNEQLFSTIQLGNEYPVELIERVEVLRGPGSVIYGGNAELSVINVITRSVQGATDLQVTGTYGELGKTFGHRNFSLSGRKVFESVPGLSAFASVAYGQGNRSDRVYTDEYGSSGSMVNAFRLDPFVIQAGIGYRDLQASVLYQSYHTTGLDGVDVILPAPAVNDFQALHAEVLNTFHINERLDLTPRFNFDTQNPWRDPDPESTFFYDKNFRRIRGRLIARWAPLDWLQLTGGADVEFDRAGLNPTTLPNPKGVEQSHFINGRSNIEYQNYAGFIEAYSENPIVNIVLGARYDRNNAFGDAFSPRIVLLRDFGPLSVKALFSRAFRAPGVENIDLGGGNIRPERTTIYELVATARLMQGMTLTANVYDLGIQDPLIYFLTEKHEDSYKNLGRLGSRGVEAEFAYRSSWGRILANYSFYAPTGKDLTPDYTVPGHPEAFAALPNHKATLSATFHALSWLDITPSAILVGTRYQVNATSADDGTALPETVQTFDTQLLLNLFVRAKDVGVKGLEIGAGAYNILGTNFQAAQPYNGGHAPMPFLSREFLLRVGYTWEAQST